MKNILFFWVIACLGLTNVTNAQKTIFSENFNKVVIPDIPSGWSAKFTTGGFVPLGWTTIDTGAPMYSHFIPNQANNKYVLVDDWYNPYNTPAILTSPSFSLSGAVHPYFSCNYYYLGGDNGNTINPLEKAWINISTDGGTTWTTIDTFRATKWTWKDKYLDISAYAGTPNVRLQFVYTDDSAHLFGIALDNIFVFDAVAHDLALTSITPADGDPKNDFFNIGSGPLFGGTVFNHGTAAVSSFNVNYKAGTGAVVSKAITGVSIPPFTSYTFTLTTPCTVTAADMFAVSMWVSLSGDTNSHNDSAFTRIYGVDHWPHKKVLFEEGTGTWCGYCVRGIVYMDSMAKYMDTSVSVVAVHCEDDPMAHTNAMTENYADLNGRACIYSYPNIYADRYVTSGPDQAFNILNSLKNNFPLADIDVTHVHVAGGMLNVSVNITPATNLAGDYRLELLLTEDSVHNSSYDQTNYYSYQADNLPMSGMGFSFQDSLEKIPGTSMYYQHVARATVPALGISQNGVVGSLPATMKTGTTYSYTFANVPIDAAWTTRCMKEIVLLINNANGYVYNTANSTLTLGIPNIAAGLAAVQVFPNPASQEAYVAFSLLQTSTMQMEVYDIAGRLVYASPPLTMGAGRQRLSLPVQTLPSGTYAVNLYTASGTVCERLVVNR